MSKKTRAETGSRKKMLKFKKIKFQIIIFITALESQVEIINLLIVLIVFTIIITVIILILFTKIHLL